MLNIRHILFPIDFSARCDGAIPFVESMARRYSAKVTLLAVAQPFYFAAMGDPGGEAVLVNTDLLFRQLKNRLDTSFTKDFDGLWVDRFVELGDPAQVIVTFAATEVVDLIMMPTHGYGPFRNLLLGSVTAKVLHDANRTLWTAAHADAPPLRDHVACRNILCAIDGSPESVSLMQKAADLSQDAGAELRLLHVVPGMEGAYSRQLDREFEEELRSQTREKIREMQVAASVPAPLCVTTNGSVASGVREEALRHEADLIVLGRGSSRRAYNIIRQSPCPVLSF